jgi:hypothetical protein
MRSLFTTQAPHALLQVIGDRFVKVEMPICEVMSCVGVSPDGKTLVVGTEYGQVLWQHEGKDWKTERPFAGDSVKWLFVENHLITAMSAKGAIARREPQKGWQVVRTPADILPGNADILTDGSLVVLFADGHIERISQQESFILDYRSMFPEEQAKAFLPLMVFAWRANPCIWGTLDRRSWVIDLTTGEAWKYAPRVDSDEKLGWLGLLGGGNIPPWVLSAWDDSHLLVHYGEIMLLGDREANLSQPESFVELDRKMWSGFSTLKPGEWESLGTTVKLRPARVSRKGKQ